MAYLNWTDDFSVNNQVLDEQHQALIAMINTLHQAMLDRRGREAQKTIIDEMVRYAAEHFALEERYMEQARFSGLPAHRLEHTAFAAKARSLQVQVNSDGFVLTLEILNFLRDWLQEHILGTDMLYARELFRRPATQPGR